MIETSRIRSGFDVEIQLGGGWFRTALQSLADAGQLFTAPLPPPLPPNPTVLITNVNILAASSEWDLAIDLTLDGIPVSLTASLALSGDGANLVITTNVPGLTMTVPFELLDGLAGSPVLKKLAGGNNEFENAISMLANLDLRASPQGADPLPTNQHAPRGTPELAQSFLPLGRAIAVGLGQATWPRIANDVWHVQLREPDGSHPLPDADNKKGDWKAVSVASHSGKIRITLVGEVPIDLWPDATVRVEIDLKPKIVGGAVTFDMSFETDFDTSLLGDLFGFLLGGLGGFIIGLVFGGLVLVPIGAIAGVVTVEVVEHIVEGEIRKELRATADGESLASELRCSDDMVVVMATPKPDEEGFSIGMFQAIPSSIPVGTDRPDALHERIAIVRSQFEDLQVDGSGFAVAGSAVAGELRQTLPAALIDTARGPAVGAEPGELEKLVYRAQDGTRVELEVAEAISRVRDGELSPPWELSENDDDADDRRTSGRLASVCLKPTAIRSKETVVTDIKFLSGAELRTPEAVQLQDAGVLVLPGYQLIHPVNANPYFRSPPNATEEDNFENLPLF